jgi:hypothetical protein
MAMADLVHQRPKKRLLMAYVLLVRRLLGAPLLRMRLDQRRLKNAQQFLSFFVCERHTVLNARTHTHGSSPFSDRERFALRLSAYFARLMPGTLRPPPAPFRIHLNM